MDLKAILWILLAITVIIAASAIAALTVLRLALRRRLRIHPKRKSAVPSHWLASPRAPARAHRRLRAATAQARFEVASLNRGLPNTADPARLVDALDELHQRAHELEQILLSAARVPLASRKTAMAAAWGELYRLEQRATLVASATTAWRQTVLGSQSLDVQPDMATLDERLEGVAALLAEAKQPILRPQPQRASRPDFHNIIDVDD